MDKQAREAREMVKSLSFKDKVKHFWEYYKWHTIVSIIVVIMIGTTIYQVATTEKYDLEIAYYGKVAITEEQTAQLSQYLSQYIEDVDGDGEKKVNILSTVIDMEEPSEYQMAVSQKFMAELAAGVHGAYIFDEWFYNYAGPESDLGAVEEAFDLRESQTGKEMLGLGEEPLYWCTKALYEKDKDKEDKIAIHNNAVSVAEILRK